MAAEQNPDMIQGAWLLLLESDYTWMKPLEVCDDNVAAVQITLAYHALHSIRSTLHVTSSCHCLPKLHTVASDLQLLHVVGATTQLLVSRPVCSYQAVLMTWQCRVMGSSMTTLIHNILRQQR